MKPDSIQLLAQTRRATIDVQRTLLNWLLQKFKLQALPGDTMPLGDESKPS
jgi:hypothetical protein